MKNVYLKSTKMNPINFNELSDMNIKTILLNIEKSFKSTIKMPKKKVLGIFYTKIYYSVIERFKTSTSHY